MDPDVSVIICSRNRAHLLERALRALFQQSVPCETFGLVVVDDASDDDCTNRLCSSLKDEFPGLIYVRNDSRTGLGAARNVGVANAGGEKLLFTDDDCIPDREWVETMASALDDHPVVAGAVDTPRDDYVKLCHNVAEFHGFMPHNTAGPTAFVAGANMAFRRSTIDEAGGFVPRRVPAEDMAFILRVRDNGHEPWFLPGGCVTHDPERTTFPAIFRYSAKHAASTVLLRNQYRSQLKTPLVLRSAPLLLLASPILALAVTAGIFRKKSLPSGYWPTLPVVYALKVAWCVGAAQGLRHRSHSAEPI